VTLPVCEPSRTRRGPASAAAAAAALNVVRLKNAGVKLPAKQSQNSLLVLKDGQVMEQTELL